MKIKQITEATSINMNLLKDLTKIILSRLPNTFVEDNTFKVMFNEKNIVDLLEKYPQKSNTINKLRQLQIDFIHKWIFVNVGTYGAYEPDKHTILINVSAISGKTSDVTLKELQSARSDNFSLLPVLVHELRHAMQWIEYKTYAERSLTSKRYKSREVEIDAAWHDVLELYDPTDFTNAKIYELQVMVALTKERGLNKKQYDHYRKKTIKYYFNNTTPQKKKNTRERYEDYIKNKIPHDIKVSISSKYSILKNFDLRKLPNYNSDKFLLPLYRILPKLQKILSGVTEPNNNFEKNMLILTAALAMPGNTKKLKDFAKYMQKVHNYSINDMINTVELGITNKENDLQYDFNSIKNYIKTQYGI